MKKKTKPLHSISDRAAFAAVMLFVLCSIDIASGLWLRESRFFPVILFLSIVALTIWTAGVIFWIIRPYRQYEGDISRFLEGYLSAESMKEGSFEMTPMSGLAFQKLGELMNSTQLKNLNRRQAQYLALQNQINPHFLYNTLDSIRSEAVISGLDIVADMTEALALFFRYTISNVANLVRLEDELENCRTYFKIQKYRFGDRLDLVIDNEETDMNVLDCLVPKLLLQPIVENSIIHGTELKIGKGTTTVHITTSRTRLNIRVSDNGVGMDQQTLRELNNRLNASTGNEPGSDKAKGGIALVNVNNRIHLIYGAEYGIHVYSVAGAGTDVEISLPVITDMNQLGEGRMEGEAS